MLIDSNWSFKLAFLSLLLRGFPRTETDQSGRGGGMVNFNWMCCLRLVLESSAAHVIRAGKFVWASNMGLGHFGGNPKDSARYMWGR